MLRLAELNISEKQVERLTERIGNERLAERDAQVAAFQDLPLVEKFQAPKGVTPPPLAVVMVDGGRMQIFDRRNSEPGAAATATTGAGSTATAPTDVEPTLVFDEDATEHRRGRFRREDKVGLLLVMDSKVAAEDPCPHIPESFVDPMRIPKLVRELKKSAPAGADAAADSDEPQLGEELLQQAAQYEPPEVVHRTVCATRLPWEEFAPQVAAAAHAAGLQKAQRKAFVADGSANNWKLHKRFFGSFTAVLDFIHALSYVFAAAQAGRKFAVGWRCYEQWIGWVWRGQVGKVIAALEQRQAEVGVPQESDAETSVAKVVAKTLGYLCNHQDKMRYDEYRKAGLPMTSSLMESAVKQVNQRVKGTEKLWSEQGGEALLQLTADHLSEGEVLEDFWQRRQANAAGQRRYRRVG